MAGGVAERRWRALLTMVAVAGLWATAGLARADPAGPTTSTPTSSAPTTSTPTTSAPTASTPTSTPTTSAPTASTPAGQTAVGLPFPGAGTAVVVTLPAPLPELPPVVRRVPGPQARSRRTPPPQAVTSLPDSEPALRTGPRAPLPPQASSGPAATPQPRARRTTPPVIVTTTSPTLAEGAAEAAKQFSFPLLLMAVVVMFLLLQALIDRRDPKLAEAPVYDELHVFR